MEVVVQKFGGSSVADVEKVRKVAERVAAARRDGRRICVVVSAMGKTTDELLALARKVSPSPARRELDMLLTAGERISMALLAMALEDLGVPAVSFTGSQAGILTDEQHASARIVEVRPVRVWEELDRGRVVIVAGFQGVSPRKEVTTLGRGGSDTTAVALAASLGADCEIYSDVDGVYTADPRVVENPRRLDEISYEEMQELARAGAKVLNADAVEFARQKGIAIHARATSGSAAETVVRGHAAPGDRVAGVTSQKGLALVELPWGGLAPAIAALGRRGATPVEVAALGGRALLVIPLDNVHEWPAARGDLVAAVPDAAVDDRDAGSVSVVGSRAGAGPGLLLDVVAALREVGEEPRAVLATPLRVTAFCAAARAPDAVRLLHRRLVPTAPSTK
ncbi:MAG: aspartate kinase [Deltaproteobacteria bacterium]